MNVKARAAVRETRAVQIQTRPDLWVSKCDGCGRHFQMGVWCNDNHGNVQNATLQGTFDRSAEGEGNMFLATVCSFKCAHRIMIGGWQTMERYKAFAEIRAVLVRASVQITTLVQSEEEAIAEWEAADPTSIMVPQ